MPVSVLLLVPRSVALVTPYGLPVPLPALLPVVPVPKPAPVVPVPNPVPVEPVGSVPNPLFEFSAMMFSPSGYSRDPARASSGSYVRPWVPMRGSPDLLVRRSSSFQRSSATPIANS